MSGRTDGGANFPGSRRPISRFWDGLLGTPKDLGYLGQETKPGPFSTSWAPLSTQQAF